MPDLEFHQLILAFYEIIWARAISFNVAIKLSAEVEQEIVEMNLRLSKLGEVY